MQLDSTMSLTFAEHLRIYRPFNTIVNDLKHRLRGRSTELRKIAITSFSPTNRVFLVAQERIDQGNMGATPHLRSVS